MNLSEFLEQLAEQKEGVALDNIMSKVRSGQSLTAREKTMLSAAIDAAKKAKTDEPGVLNAIMSKVGKGQKLTPEEEVVLSAALDAAKKEKK